MNQLLFLALHATPLALFYIEINLLDWALCAGLYGLRMFGVTAGYHRYFSHRAFRTGRFFQFCLAVLAQSAAQKGVLWWAANHRRHHAASDTIHDVHSPVQRGFWYAHLGWWFGNDHNKTDLSLVKDFSAYPELRWLDRYHVLPFLGLALITFWIGGWSGLVVGFLLSTLLLFHATLAINSIGHMWGGRRFSTRDASRNNPVLALLTLGEGWHNNHHYFPSAARQGFHPLEIDVTYVVLRFLALTGLVYDLKPLPDRIMRDMRAPHSGNPAAL
ncbi:MAG: acyl-CoA desaturase [Leptospiraceae bacterium]|nr:acyl-CoA desaturase [Leptospiraceae bacterium]